MSTANLDEYINNYYIRHFDDIFKPKESKGRRLNFSNLSQEQKIVQINLSVKIEDTLIVKYKIEWDLSQEKKSPELFAIKLIDNLSGVITDEELRKQNKRSIRNQIFEQMIDHLCKLNPFPRFKVIHKPSELEGLNQLCYNCGTLIYNTDFCINCLYVFDKKSDKKHSHEEDKGTEDAQLTDRQRILQLRQKNINIEEGYMNEEEQEKKVCKKCGEINEITCTICKNCSFKFPIITCYDVYNNNQSYCIHFWDKINKNHIIQQLKSFSNLFNEEDFSSLKYLYERIKEILRINFKEILTEEAFYEVNCNVDKIYNLFSHPSLTSEKAFDSAYRNKYGKNRPVDNCLNYNKLLDIKEGYLPETNSMKIYEDKKDDKAKVNDSLLKKKRKRGRPKKMEIFRGDVLKQNEAQILLQDRDKLLIEDIKIEDDLLHYDFCGKCFLGGKLICCETCSSAYHYECLGYDKFPRGKFKCYFCKIVKLGFDQALTVNKSQMRLVAKLIHEGDSDKWYSKASELLEVLKAHHCSCFFKEPMPPECKEYYEKTKEPSDLSLIEIKLNNWEYKTLKEFIVALRAIWSSIKEYYTVKSFFRRQADTLEMLVNHLLKNEKIFAKFDFEKEITEEEKEAYIEEKKKEKILKQEEEEEEERVKEKIKKAKGSKGKKKKKTKATKGHKQSASKFKEEENDDDDDDADADEGPNEEEEDGDNDEEDKEEEEENDDEEEGEDEEAEQREGEEVESNEKVGEEEEEEEADEDINKMEKDK